jgi:Putative MetA-pathway of phenol degradation
MTFPRRLLLVAMSWILCAPAASAQSVSDVLTFLVTNQSVPTGNVARDRNAAQATADTIGRALLANLATLPVPSTSGAFAYHLNPELGTVERTTQTFGPSFVERAQTAGRGQVSFGLAFQYLRFDSLDGRNLRDGSLVTTANKFVDETTPFDADRLSLAIDVSVATLYGNAGITDRLDVAVIVPMVSMQVSGSRLDNYRGQTFMQATASSHAVGLADMIVRSKYALYNSPGGSVAAAVDVRLPTGRREDLLGAGTASTRFSGIGSLERGRLSASGNAGVTFGGLARELNYDGAVAVAAAPRVTIAGEILGRWIDGPGHVVEVTTPHPTLAGVQTIRLTPDASPLNIVTLVPGLKWNLTDTWVLAANVTIPLTNAGLTASYTPFIGLDYAFGR